MIAFIQHLGGQRTYVGSPIQYVDLSDRVLAATVLQIDAGSEDNTIALRAYDPDGRTMTCTGVKLDAQDAVLKSQTWRPLPIPASPSVELPVQQFVETLTPVVEAAVEACVEAKLAARASS